MRNTVLVSIGVLLMLTACSGGLFGPKGPPTPNTVQTAVALGVQQTETSIAVQDINAKETDLAVATRTAVWNKTATRAAVIHAYRLQGSQTATPESVLAQPVMDNLIAGGYIPSTGGEYIKLDDFDQTFERRDYFHRYTTGQYPTNFVMHANLTMGSSEDNDTTVAGCGFSFRKANDNTGSYVLLDFRGNVRYGVIDPDYWQAHGIEKGIVQKPLTPQEVWLVVVNRNYFLFVNGVEVFSYKATNSEGLIFYLIAAGSVPMHCTYENVWIWDLGD